VARVILLLMAYAQIDLYNELKITIN